MLIINSLAFVFWNVMLCTSLQSLMVSLSWQPVYEHVHVSDGGHAPIHVVVYLHDQLFDMCMWPVSHVVPFGSGTHKCLHVTVTSPCLILCPISMNGCNDGA